MCRYVRQESGSHYGHSNLICCFFYYAPSLFPKLAILYLGTYLGGTFTSATNKCVFVYYPAALHSLMATPYSST